MKSPYNAFHLEERGDTMVIVGDADGTVVGEISKEEYTGIPDPEKDGDEAAAGETPVSENKEEEAAVSGTPASESEEETAAPSDAAALLTAAGLLPIKAYAAGSVSFPKFFRQMGALADEGQASEIAEQCLIDNNVPQDHPLTNAVIAAAIGNWAGRGSYQSGNESVISAWYGDYGNCSAGNNLAAIMLRSIGIPAFTFYTTQSVGAAVGHVNYAFYIDGEWWYDDATVGRIYGLYSLGAKIGDDLNTRYPDPYGDATLGFNGVGYYDWNIMSAPRLDLGELSSPYKFLPRSLNHYGIVCELYDNGYYTITPPPPSSFRVESSNPSVVGWNQSTFKFSIGEPGETVLTVWEKNECVDQATVIVTKNPNGKKDAFIYQGIPTEGDRAKWNTDTTLSMPLKLYYHSSDGYTMTPAFNKNIHTYDIHALNTEDDLYIGNIWMHASSPNDYAEIYVDGVYYDHVIARQPEFKLKPVPASNLYHSKTQSVVKIKAPSGKEEVYTFNIIVDYARLTLDLNGGSYVYKYKSGKIQKQPAYFDGYFGEGHYVGMLEAYRADYEFTGWYTAKKGGKKIDDCVAVPKNKTIYAHWTPSDREPTFNDIGYLGDEAGWVTVLLRLNGGTPPKGQLKSTMFTQFPKGEVGNNTDRFKPTMKGYTFTGWYTAKKGGSKVTASTVVTKHSTFYAHWKAKSFTVKYNVNKGKALKTKSKTVKFGSSYGKLATPKRTGYTFDGWYTKKTGGVKITKGTKVDIAKTHTLYAHWTPKK
jgi:uncharacterized repeat protein (TIGR02543 family)